MNPIVIIPNTLPKEWMIQLEGRVEPITSFNDEKGVYSNNVKDLKKVEGILTLLSDRIDTHFLDRMPSLRVVSNMAAGIDNIDIDACTSRGIPVGNTPGVMTEATADITFALILAVVRRLPESSSDAREGRWEKWTPTGWLGADLNGSTIGIIGMGKIGMAVARRARGFGMQVVYWEPARSSEKEKLTDAKYLPFDKLLSTSDIVTIHCPLNDSTRGLIDATAFKMMKPTSILINAARGPIVNTDVLYLALTEKWISSAGLDVTDPEPLPKDHPLYALSNCLILPHIGSATYGTRKRMAEIACQNLLAGLDGRRMPYCVNRDVYTNI
jgi:glyoxylate reductase